MAHLVGKRSDVDRLLEYPSKPVARSRSLPPVTGETLSATTGIRPVFELPAQK
jgi:hypothetical protein